MKKNLMLQSKDRVARWIRTQDPYISYLNLKTYFRLIHTQTKIMGWTYFMMGLEGTKLNGVNQIEEDKCHVTACICGT